MSSRVVVQTPSSSMGFALRLKGILGDVNGSSTRRQCSMNAKKTQCMQCEHLESVMRVQRIANKNSVGT